MERASQNLRGALAGAVAEHLERVAVLLRAPCGTDAVAAAAERIVAVVAALEEAAGRLGCPLPPQLAAELAASTQGLRGWAAALQPQRQRAAWAASAGGGQPLAGWGWGWP